MKAMLRNWRVWLAAAVGGSGIGVAFIVAVGLNQPNILVGGVAAGVTFAGLFLFHHLARP